MIYDFSSILPPPPLSFIDVQCHIIIGLQILLEILTIILALIFNELIRPLLI